MQTLARQRSRSSVLSWWSDSNPPGATINIHAVAKPLMRFMYHRQALDLIKNNEPGALSSALLEAYSAYLSCKYVSLATKGAVLRELRGVSHEDDPCTVILGDEVVLSQVVELVNSTGIANTLRIDACGILGNVVASPAPTHSQRTELCRSLVSLIRDKDIRIAAAARGAISSAASTLKAAEAAIDAGVLEYLSEILGSPNGYVREWPRKLMTDLASHNLGRTYCPRLCVWLIPFLRVAEHDVVEAATHALSLVSKSREGAETVIDAKAANYLEQLLKSESAEISRRTWELMKQLASHESTAPVIFPLVLRGHDFDLPDGLPADAIWTLLDIAKWSDDADWRWEAVDKEVLDGTAELLKSRQPLVCRFACAVAGNMAAYRHPAASAVLGVKICVQLVSLIRNGSGTLTEAAIYALCRICRLQHGVQDVVEAKTLEKLWQLLDWKSPRMTELPAGYCELMQTLAYRSLTSSAIVSLPSSLRVRLASLLCGPDENTRSCLTALLLSGDSEVQTWAWWLVLRLVDREAVEKPSAVQGFTTRSSELENSANPSPNPVTISSQTAQRFDVSEHPETRHYLINLAKSSNTELQRWTGWLRARLAHDDPMWDEPRVDFFSTKQTTVQYSR
ncbi:armadillo-type protein [Mycena galericulata]|nr:armadillo-type protein [Mycena galericulata]